MHSRVSMQLPLNKTDGPTSAPDPVQRAAIALELTRNQETKAALEVVKQIHETADERGKMIESYLDKTQSWLKDMKELIG